MALKSDIAILQQAPLLRDLEPAALQLLAFAAEARTYKAGDVLFRRGDASDGGFVVTGGAVSMDAGAGAKPLVVGPGALIGELAMIVDTERPATALAAETTTVLRITRDMFRRVMQEFPESAAAMRDAIAEEARATAGKLSAIGYRLAAVDLAEERLRKGRGA
ncbi:cyclic nucleotide-binding protein [Alsobacter soli]|uniref:Cyclic nucleotide-binding protein n=1 Tax=Alsobacter soli TaxID=2109933 RepID=A0A2T1HSZ6_9HYPH|nr:Crp/Fnr family transcriptional regulator [Alsobacter soli]PSC04781.1 cyclic nucleotide-binding protein [Alsobacter soli]